MDSTTDQTVAEGVVNMPKTDKTGTTTAKDLELGLYLFVETETPENVVETVILGSSRFHLRMKAHRQAPMV